MYNHYLEIKQTEKTGLGLFSTIDIPANEPVLEYTGDIISIENIDKYIYGEILQVSPYSFIGASGSIDDYINHSCDPNCRIHVVGNRAILYSLYIIKPGMELTVDYSTTDLADNKYWEMQCNCGQSNCRKNISGFYSLPKELQEKYIQNGMAALYLKTNIFTRKVN